MAIYPNIYQTLVPCPIVELRGYLAACGLKGRLYAYLDYNGPTGTSRDSVAEGMLALAAEKHKLLPGQPIIEAACGRNTCSGWGHRSCIPPHSGALRGPGRWKRPPPPKRAGTI